MMRVQKYLSRAGVCSRREGEDLMQQGRVKVNGEVCSELGSKVDPDSDRVEVDGDVVELPEQFTYMLLNKPTGYVTTLDDPHADRDITDLLDEGLPRIWPVGRLDEDSQGALLMTNDGRLTNGLTHPSFEAEKVYRVEVEPSLSTNSKKLKRLRDGVQIGGGEWTAPAKISVLDQKEGASVLRFGLIEGKNRQIRKMCKTVGHTVVDLERIEIGPVELGDLEPGETRPLSGEEIEALYDETGQQMLERAEAAVGSEVGPGS